MEGIDGSQKGAFSAEEDEIYLQLLNQFGKPTRRGAGNPNPNPEAEKKFTEAFSNRSLISIKCHISAFTETHKGVFQHTKKIKVTSEGDETTTSIKKKKKKEMEMDYDFAFPYEFEDKNGEMKEYNFPRHGGSICYEFTTHCSGGIVHLSIDRKSIKAEIIPDQEIWTEDALEYTGPLQSRINNDSLTELIQKPQLPWEEKLSKEVLVMALQNAAECLVKELP